MSKKVTIVIVTGFCAILSLGAIIIQNSSSNDNLFDPMPLRVGTVGAQYYHRPFSPTAQRALALHGPGKRINWYSIDEIPSNRIPAKDSFAGIFEVPKDPEEFVSGRTYKAIRNHHSIPQIPEDKTICTWSGYAVVAVHPEHCREDGAIIMNAESETEVLLSYFNAIPSGIGDATGDGNIDSDDFPYLVACYSGEGQVQDCSNCERVFDYDEDKDVDYDDFMTWFSELGTGNRAWIMANHPSAIEKQKSTYPLRVGMEGSNLYHMPDCPAVLRARTNYGWHRFIEYYTEKAVRDSGRTPDVVGTPNGCNASINGS